MAASLLATAAGWAERGLKAGCGDESPERKEYQVYENAGDSSFDYDHFYFFFS